MQHINEYLLLAALVLILWTVSAVAQTDPRCMIDCTQSGALYGFCESRCSYYAASPIPTRVDPKCMIGCTSRGFLYSYCQQACAY